ncbi:MAG: diaminopimelate decarboxylase [Armatimonadota bacterium]
MLFGTQKINSKGHLEIGGCDAVDLAKKFGTPLYVMDETLIRQNCRDYQKSFKSRYENTSIAFAGKAFLNTAMCRIVDQEDMYLDVASAGEMYTAMKADFPMERTFFHGNAKPRYELEMALQNGVGRIVVDNIDELELLNTIAMEMGKKADIIFRCTPGIDPHTHRLISTGQADTKFGLNIKDGSAMAAIKRSLECPGITFKGIHCHVGSQLLDLEAHVAGIRIMVEFAKQILDEIGVAIDEINTGGGLGIRYIEGQVPPTIDDFAEVITSTYLNALDEFGMPSKPRLIQEPGRSIVGTAGTTLYTVGNIKRVPITEDPGYRVYAAVDGGLSDNPRPLLYEAVYYAFPANKADKPTTQVITISGRHCETDTLIQDIKITDIEAGDILAVQCTGAYNFSMASNYNRFIRPAAVLVSDGRAELIIERETLDDLVRHDIIPASMSK